MISNLSKEQWDAKVAGLGGSILQSWNWGEFQKALGQNIFRFSGNDFANLAVEHELPLGKKYIYCPRGPLGNTVEALLDLKKMSDDRTIIFTRIEPYEKVDLPRATKEVQPSHNWVLNLEKTAAPEGRASPNKVGWEEEILVAMKPKTRYNINLAQRKGVVVKEGGESDLLDFWKLMMETASRQGIKLHPQNYYWRMWEHLAPDNLKLLLAYYNDQPVAAMLLGIFGETATYLHGGTSQKFREAMAVYLLHWQAIVLAKNSGCKLYDFGGISPDGNPAHAWAGITRFKKSFGGFEVAYPGTFDLVFSPIWYNVYKQGRKLNSILRK